MKHLARPLALLLLALARPAAAQTPDTTRLYGYVDQLPALPGGGGTGALLRAVQQRLELPPETRSGQVEGRVFVRVVVGVSGVVRQPAVVQSLSPACDAAALAAVRQLPRLRPARYRRQPVATLLNLPVGFYSPRHVFEANEVARAAQFPGGPSALEAYLARELRLPAEVRRQDLRGRTVVRFVLRPDGRVGAAEVVSSLCGSCDDEALRLVRELPRWQPAQGYDDKPVAVYQTLNVWFQPPPPPAGTAPPTPENQVYTRVEQQPELPGGGGTGFIQNTLQELIEYPARRLAGQGQVSFVVEPDGRVTRPVMVQPIGADVDEAVLAAVLRLPRFRPGQQRGQAVAVRLLVPVKVEIW